MRLKYWFLISPLLCSLGVLLPTYSQGIEVIPIEPNPSPSSLPPTAPQTPIGSVGQRFSCKYQNGDYLVVYEPENQPGEVSAWARPRTLGGGWSAERRCTEIARRLELYRPDGLSELRTSQENGYDVVCATTDRIPSCRIVFTVPPGQDPITTRDRVFANLVAAERGQFTAPVNTFRGNSSSFLDLLRQQPSPQRNRSQGIFLKPFLSPQDGGTSR